MSDLTPADPLSKAARQLINLARRIPAGELDPLDVCYVVTEHQFNALKAALDGPPRDQEHADELAVMEPAYVLQQTARSFCPDCHTAVRLLIAHDARPDWPAFYLCPSCGFVGQAGVGPVPLTEEDR